MVGEELQHAGQTSWQNALKSKVSTDAMQHQQFFANYMLDAFIEAHTDDLHGTRPGPALDLVPAILSQKFRFKIWTERSGHEV